MHGVVLKSTFPLSHLLRLPRLMRLREGPELQADL